MRPDGVKGLFFRGPGRKVEPPTGSPAGFALGLPTPPQGGSDGRGSGLMNLIFNLRKTSGIVIMSGFGLYRGGANHDET